MSSPTKLSSTWQIRSDSARVPRSPKASKSPKAHDKQSDEDELLPAVQSATSMSASSTLDVHPEIRTGNDVVEFYAKYGQDSPVKFFYCNRYLGNLPACASTRCYPFSRSSYSYEFPAALQQHRLANIAIAVCEGQCMPAQWPDIHTATPPG